MFAQYTFTHAETAEQIEQARKLFREYESWFGLNLCFQNFDREVAELPGRYAKPDGRLLLAYNGDDLTGCIALRRLGNGICEMKRLYVREKWRGQGIGKALIERLLAEAAAIGYVKMRLDTYPPKMPEAVALYRAYGFREVSPYYHNPYGETLYMEKNLTKNS